jgi:hypothetical protein
MVLATWVSGCRGNPGNDPSPPWCYDAVFLRMELFSNFAGCCLSGTDLTGDLGYTTFIHAASGTESQIKKGSLS